jgi:hypothetical protein
LYYRYDPVQTINKLQNHARGKHRIAGKLRKHSGRRAYLAPELAVDGQELQARVPVLPERRLQLVVEGLVVRDDEVCFPVGVALTEVR